MGWMRNLPNNLLPETIFLGNIAPVITHFLVQTPNDNTSIYISFNLLKPMFIPSPAEANSFSKILCPQHIRTVRRETNDIHGLLMTNERVTIFNNRFLLRCVQSPDLRSHLNVFEYTLTSWSPPPVAKTASSRKSTDKTGSLWPASCRRCHAISIVFTFISKTICKDCANTTKRAFHRKIPRGLWRQIVDFWNWNV